MQVFARGSTTTILNTYFCRRAVILNLLCYDLKCMGAGEVIGTSHFICLSLGGCNELSRRIRLMWSCTAVIGSAYLLTSDVLDLSLFS